MCLAYGWMYSRLGESRASPCVQYASTLGIVVAKNFVVHHETLDSRQVYFNSLIYPSMQGPTASSLVKKEPIPRNEQMFVLPMPSVAFHYFSARFTCVVENSEYCELGSSRRLLNQTWITRCPCGYFYFQCGWAHRSPLARSYFHFRVACIRHWD